MTDNLCCSHSLWWCSVKDMYEQIAIPNYGEARIASIKKINSLTNYIVSKCTSFFRLALLYFCFLRDVKPKFNFSNTILCVRSCDRWNLDPNLNVTWVPYSDLNKPTFAVSMEKEADVPATGCWRASWGALAGPITRQAESESLSTAGADLGAIKITTQ